MTHTQFNEIAEWQIATFGHATSTSKIAHLAEELIELINEIKAHNTQNAHMEFADCFMLLFGAAAAFGMTYPQICSAIDEKLKINKTRTWGNPDENGVVRHIK